MDKFFLAQSAKDRARQKTWPRGKGIGFFSASNLIVARQIGEEGQNQGNMSQRKSIQIIICFKYQIMSIVHFHASAK